MKDDIGSGTGKYVLSTTRNTNGPKFGSKLEDNSLKSKTYIPGPGAYEQPSDFGRLDLLSLKTSRRGNKKIKKNSELTGNYDTSRNAKV